MSWNGQLIKSPQWNGNRASSAANNNSNFNYLNANYISSGTVSAAEINVSSINACNIVGYNNYLDYIRNINIVTNVITLDGQGLTATPGGLYLNSELIGVVSSISSIGDWSKFKALTDVDMANSTIKNVLGISSLYLSTSLIKCDTIRAIGGQIDTLYGNDQIYYPKGKIQSLAACNALVSTLTASDPIYTDAIYNQTEISTFSLEAQRVSSHIIDNYYTDGVLNGNKIFANNVSTIIVEFGLATGNTVSTIGVVQNTSIIHPIDDGGGGIEEGGLIFLDNSSNLRGLVGMLDNTSTITVAGFNNAALIGQLSSIVTGFCNVTINTKSDTFTESILLQAPIVNIDAGQLNTRAIMSTNTIYTDLLIGNIGDFGILNASTITFTDLSAVNITASNITTGQLNVTDNANITNLAANGLTVNDSANYNTYISFGTNNSELYGAQYLYDINSVRNLQVEKITVLGGWTGDDVIPPYYNDSIVEIGEDTIRPGQVTINGFNPDPLDTGTALTVRGDTQITQNLNVLGLTTLEGLVETIGDLNVDGSLQVQGDVEITGITTATGVFNTIGDANVGGILTVTGETNLLGAVTAEAGIGIVGAMGLTGGNVTFGSSIDTGYNFNVYYTAYFNNNVDMTKHNINNVDVLYFTNAANENQYFFQYATYTYLNSTTVETLKFNDCPFLYNSAVSVGQNSLLDIRDIQFVDQVNGGYQYMSVFDNEVVLTLFDYSNNYIRSSWVAETWSKFKAIQGVNIDNQDINAVNQLNASTIVTNAIYTATLGQPDPYVPTAINVNNGFEMGGNTISNVGKMYYSSTRQPFIQFGDVSFAGGGTKTVSLPVDYANSNYVITATYSVDPGASAKPIHIDSRTTSNFTISAQSGHAAFWTTFGFNN